MQLVGGMCMARNASLAQNQRLLRLVLDGIRARDPQLDAPPDQALRRG